MKNLFLDLDEQQRKVVKHIEGPVIVFAGAGTGKTRVITYRIAYLLSLGINPSNILAVTFTNKAAEEMKTRVMQLIPGKGEKVWISTFHSFCAHFLRKEGEKVGVRNNFVIYDENDQKQIIKECIKDIPFQNDELNVELICDIINRAKDNLIDSESYKINTLVFNDSFRKIVSDIYLFYQRKLFLFNGLDFGDLLMKTVECLKTFPEVREKYSNKYKYIHIDEFQDINYAQIVLSKLLASEHNNICVVGDDDQAIYSWRGGDVRYILNFKKEFHKVKEFKLEKNYRSTKIILDVSNRVISHNINRVKKKLWTEDTDCSDSDVRIIKIHNEYEEAQFISQEIKQLAKSGKFKNIGVFYRTNAQSRVFEEIFLNEGIPYKIFGSVSFYARQEIKDILAYLRILVNPDDNISLKRVINVPSRGISDTTVLYLETLAKERGTSLWQQLLKIDDTELSLKTKNAVWKFLSLYDVLKKYKDSMFLSEYIQFLIDKTGYLKMLETRVKDKSCEKTYDRIENIKELIFSAKSYEEQNVTTIEEFLNKVSLLTKLDEESVSQVPHLKNFSVSVALMTLHIAKGLEFDIVFLTGLEEGVFPTWWAVKSQGGNIEEERRLCYVGITRAKKLLYLTYSETRRLWGIETCLQPSRFLFEVQEYFREKNVLQENYVNKEKVSTEKVKIDSLKLGEYVFHDKFGIGKVIDIFRDASGDKIVVLFNDGEKRKLHLSYAPVRKII